ncbi:class I SAM-dependent methyltransferase [Mariniluteicoccus endophyticus]
MEPELARTLVSATGRAVLEMASQQDDPTSMAAATALRKDFPPDLAAAALSQTQLRRRATAKFGSLASSLYFTPAGLEQATRPDVARWRAEALAATGVTKVVDLGCGIGTDAMAFVAAGLEVRAVELDETTAVLAAANLGRLVECADAEEVTLADDEAAYCDPARRSDRGRLWRTEDFTPGWDFVLSLLERDAGACIKLGPALPHRMVPAGVGARWVSHHGDVVEVSLWARGFKGMGAVLLPEGVEIVAPSAAPGGGTAGGWARSELVGGTRAGDVGGPALVADRPGAYVFEPDGAVIRCGAVDALAAEFNLARLAPDIAYLTGDRPVDIPFLTRFSVREVLPYKERALRRWVTDGKVGTLEIKKRGIDVDPAALRKRLRPKGPGSATLILSPGPAGAYAIVADRGTPTAPARLGATPRSE